VSVINRMSQAIVPKAFTELPSEADKRSIISTLAKSLVTARKIKAGDVDEVVEGAMAREAVGSTGIGHGIAIPHCRTDLVKNISCAFGRCAEGLDFESLDGEAVHSVFLLLTPNDQKEQHLHLMKNFAGIIRRENFCDFLSQTIDAEGLISLLAEFEEEN
jgi:mannitol/fructose-specific phosphotransferase system IIA component (Ntr-type)